MKTYSLVVFVFFCVGIAGCFLFKTKYEEIPPRFPASILSLGKVNSEWTFRSLQRDTLKIGKFLGKKLFVNFWATWCSPCLAEMPGLQALYDSKKSDSTIVFLFLSDEDQTTVQDFISKTSYTLPLYLCEPQRSSEFNSGGYPSTFIVSSRGEIVYKKLGTAKWNHPSVMEFFDRVP